MFKIFKANCQEQEGVPIVRIAGQLSAIGKAIYRELEPGVRDPECFWGWLGKKRNDLKSSGRRLTKREIYNCFKDRSVVKPHMSAEIIRKPCLTISFRGDLEESASDIFRENFPVS